MQYYAISEFWLMMIGWDALKRALLIMMSHSNDETSFDTTTTRVKPW